jgi:ribosomal protein S18 acetylase RimI-like enzyme
MPPVEIRPAVASDLPRLTAMDHSCQSDYVWQLELKREAGQVHANFREVRLPRTVDVKYPRDPFALGEEWMKRDLLLAAVQETEPVGYLSAMENPASGIVWVTDLVVAPERRRQGIGSALLNAAQAWALERGARRILLETQSKNQPCIRMAQKYGYEFCGYNDQYYPTQDVALFFGRGLR